MTDFGPMGMGGALFLALAVMVGVSLLVFGDFNAESGGLKQKQGLAGCISADGSGGFSDATKKGECAVGRALGQPITAAASPDGNNLYVVGHREAVAILDRDPRNGTLTQIRGPAGCHSNDGTAGGQRAQRLRQPPELSRQQSCRRGRALFGVSAIAVSRDGRNAYTGSLDGIAVFDRDSSGGTLTQKRGRAGCLTVNGSERSSPGGPRCATAPGLFSAGSVTVSPDGANVYVTSADLLVFDRDAGSGVLTKRSGRAGCLASSGEGAGNVKCVKAPTIDGARDVVLSPDGKQAYVPSGAGTRTQGGVTILDRHRSGGLRPKPGRAGCLSLTGSGGRCTSTRGLRGAATIALSADGRTAYVVAVFGCAVLVFDRNSSSGALTQKPGAAGVVTTHGEHGACARKQQRERTGRAGGSIIISPQGTSAYVSADAGLAFFDRAPATGGLDYRGCVSDDGEGTCADVRAFNDPFLPIVSRDGRNIYVLASGSDAVIVLDSPGAASG